MSTPAQKTIELDIGNDCTIYQAADLHEKLTSLLNKESSINIDISSIQQIDASFLQLLVAAHKQAEQQDRQLTVSGESDTVNKWVNQLYCNTALSGDSGDSGDIETSPDQEPTHES